MAGVGNALARQHDLGMGIYHYAGNALLPLVWLAAGNKAEFGCATVCVPNGRLAVALIPMVGINLQLDCNDVSPAISLPLPTSVCDASTNTVFAGFSLADCLGGFASMFMDAVWVGLLSYGIGKYVAPALGSALGAGIGWLGGPTALLAAGGAGVIFATALPQTTIALRALAETVIGFIIGSPVGYSFDTPWGGLGGKANNALNNWISPTPEADARVPSSAPDDSDSAGAPSPAPTAPSSAASGASSTAADSDSAGASSQSDASASSPRASDQEKNFSSPDDEPSSSGQSSGSPDKNFSSPDDAPSSSGGSSGSQQENSSSPDDATSSSDGASSREEKNFSSPDDVTDEDEPKSSR
jgi:hypothetical protein